MNTIRTAVFVVTDAALFLLILVKQKMGIVTLTRSSLMRNSRYRFILSKEMDRADMRSSLFEGFSSGMEGAVEWNIFVKMSNDSDQLIRLRKCVIL